MATDTHAEQLLNQRIAERLGWKVERFASTRQRWHGKYAYRLFNPQGEKVSEYDDLYMSDVDEWATEEFAWQQAPDYVGSLDATSAVLEARDITMRLDYGPASAARLIPETYGEDPLVEYVCRNTEVYAAERRHTDMAELAARALLMLLDAQVEEG